jgi:hypothetical protein
LHRKYLGIQAIAKAECCKSGSGALRMSENLVLPRPGTDRLARPAVAWRARLDGRAFRIVGIRALLIGSLLVALYDAALHGLALVMGHDAYMAAAGLVVWSEAIPPAGAVPDLLRPIAFPSFDTWAAYDLFWFLIHAAVAAVLAAVLWGTWRGERG